MLLRARASWWETSFVGFGDFEGAAVEVEGADFEDDGFEGVDFEDDGFEGADFEDGLSSGADFEGVDFEGVGSEEGSGGLAVMRTFFLEEEERDDFEEEEEGRDCFFVDSFIGNVRLMRLESKLSEFILNSRIDQG